MGARTHNQLRRLLVLIDTMAAFSFPKSTTEIMDRLNDAGLVKCGRKTVERDLQLLVDMGLVKFSGRRDESKFGCGAYTFQLDLPRTERLQSVAIHLLDKENENRR